MAAIPHSRGPSRHRHRIRCTAGFGRGRPTLRPQTRARDGYCGCCGKCRWSLLSHSIRSTSAEDWVRVVSASRCCHSSVSRMPCASNSPPHIADNAKDVLRHCDPRSRLRKVHLPPMKGWKTLLDFQGFLDIRYTVLALGAFVTMLVNFVPYYYISQWI